VARGRWSTGGVVEWPTREELYVQVDEWFRRDHPDAPAVLSADAPAHAEWRESWLRMRAVLLDEIVNRAYWDMHPDAPIKIDPNNPAHERYEAIWLALREAILVNAPEPPLEAGEIDVSQLRSMCYELVAYRWDEIREELHSDIRATIETMIDNYVTAVRAGTAPNIWLSDVVELASNEDPEHKVKLRLQAFFYQGRHTGGLEIFEIEKPLST
jgi:hypothetical protein